MYIQIKQPTTAQIQCYPQKAGAISRATAKKTISFLLQKDGTIKFIEPYEKDEDDFYKVNIDIVQNCGFQFSPGKIKGQSIDTQVYFPIEFLK